MSLVMAFGMEHYNLSIGQDGFEMWMFKVAWHWKDIPLMTVIVFIMEHFIAGPIAQKKAFKLVTPGKNPLLITLTVAGCTVLLMCPIMVYGPLLFLNTTDSKHSSWFICRLLFAISQLPCYGRFFCWSICQVAFPDTI